MKLKIFKSTDSNKLENEVNAFLSKEGESILLHSCGTMTGITGEATLFVGSVFYEDIAKKPIKLKR